MHKLQLEFSCPSSPNFPRSYSLASPILSRPLDICVGVDASYLVELHAGDLVFLKANRVAYTLEFDQNLPSRTRHPIYDTHLCHNLPGGRKYVHVHENRITGVRKHQGPSTLALHVSSRFWMLESALPMNENTNASDHSAGSIVVLQVVAIDPFGVN